jgi:hypothetical protein
VDERFPRLLQRVQDPHPARPRLYGPR